MAFYVRHLNQALHVTPDSHPWKASAEDALYQQLTYMDGYRSSGGCNLGVFNYGKPNKQVDQRATTANPNYEMAFWQYVWVVAELNKAVNAKMLTNSSQLAEITTLRDWMLDGAIRMVNQQAHTGGWRYHCQYHPIGSRGAWAGNADGVVDGNQYFWNGTDHGSFATWDVMAQSVFSDYPPPSVTGTFMVNGDTGSGAYSNFQTTTAANHQSQFDYHTTVWPWLCMAAESELPGSSEMWTTVRSGLTNLPQFLDGFATDLEDGIWPRNKPLDV
jgi:hypothetical protein